MKQNATPGEKSMRIAVGQILQETNTFSPRPCALADFEEGGLHLGEEILRRMRGTGEIGGLMAVMEREAPEARLVPIIKATAMPGGMISESALEYLRGTLADGLKRSLPVDGVFLSLHGAAASDRIRDVDGSFAASVRDVVGPRVPIVLTLDHHANVTRLMTESVNVMTAYHVQPHDPLETGQRAARILLSLVRGTVHPTVSWQKIPMLTPADRMQTDEWPMSEWFGRAREMEKLAKVITVCTFPVNPWLDVPELGWAVVVVTDGDRKLADRLSSELANAAWALRHEFWKLDRKPLAQGIRMAAEAPEGPMLIPDRSDCVLSGAPGDSTLILGEMLRQNLACVALLPMVDPEVVEKAIAAGEGSTITVRIGGKMDTVFNEPLTVTGTVAGIAAGGLKVTIHWGTYDMGRSVLLEIGNVKLVVSEYRGVGGIQPEMYRSFGLDPAKAGIIVVKTNGNFQYYASMMKGVIAVDTKGVTGWDLRTFRFDMAPRPLFPLDQMSEWHAQP
jgi:microcystin degradation protein MlrC